MTSDLSPRTREEVVGYLVMLRDFAAACSDDLCSDGTGYPLTSGLGALLADQCGENARNHLIDAIGETLTLLGVPNGGE